MTTATAITHKELTANIRAALKAAGIKARVRKQEYCGCRVIQVFVPAYGITFTDDEQNAIIDIAEEAGLTYVQGLPILRNGTNPTEFNLHMGYTTKCP